MSDDRRPRLRLGGMALRNGLLVHGPTQWAVAVRDGEGNIRIASAPKPKLAPAAVAKIPVLRGPIRLGEAMLVVPLARWKLRQVRLPFEDMRVLGAVGAGFALSRLVRRFAPGRVSREVGLQITGLLPALAALGNRDLTAYHGSEHKVIGAYEQGLDDPTPVPKEHDRCGSNLIAPLMVLSVGGTVAIESAVKNPGPLLRSATSFLASSTAIEMFAWSDRNREHPLAQAFHAQGREIQRRFATSEPSPEQLEVGMAALREILRVEPPPEEQSAQPFAGGTTPA